MNPVERAEAVLARHMGLVPPWDQPLPRKALEYVLERIWGIEAFREQGLGLVHDPARRELIVKHLGPSTGAAHEDYNFNVWLANECMGDPPPARHILLRCSVCLKLRTHRTFSHRFCKCGSRQLTSATPTDLNTRMVMKALVMGR